MINLEKLQLRIEEILQDSESGIRYTQVGDVRLGPVRPGRGREWIVRYKVEIPMSLLGIRSGYHSREYDFVFEADMIGGTQNGIEVVYQPQYNIGPKGRINLAFRFQGKLWFFAGRIPVESIAGDIAFDIYNGRWTMQEVS